MANSIFQTKEWADFKCQTGWVKQYQIDDILVLEKKLPLGRTVLYSPMIGESEKLKVKSEKFLKQIKTIAGSKTIFYRLEFNIPIPPHTPPSLGGDKEGVDSRGLELRKAFEEMQPEHTLILDISKSDEEILAQMKQKGRYNIKIAERSGITITESNQPGTELDAFYELYAAMAKRQKISCRGESYFGALLANLGEKGYARLYGASIIVEGKKKTLASAIIVFYGNRATYLFGGSSNEYRNLMAPYLLHWHIIKEAKKRGCAEYDFFGIAPDGNPNHPWSGVTRFKKQFGGVEVHLAGSWDLVFKPVEYQLFKIAEKIRR